MLRDLEHPEVTCAIRTGYPSWMQETEVLNDEELTKPTHHPKIMIASVREYDYEEVLANEIRLHELSFSFDDMAIVKLMKEIVPEYKSKCSKYEVLD